MTSFAIDYLKHLSYAWVTTRSTYIYTMAAFINRSPILAVYVYQRFLGKYDGITTSLHFVQSQDTQ